MDYATPLARLRLLLADPAGRIWPDHRLLDYLSQAQDEFARQTGCLRQVFDICPDSDGTFSVPPDYLKYVYGLNIDAATVGLYTMERLIADTADDTLSQAGTPTAIYFYGVNKYGVYPVPEQEPLIPAFDDDFGILDVLQEYDTDTGIEFRGNANGDMYVFDAGVFEPNDFWGIACSLDDYRFESEWGTIDELTWFAAAATIWYSRLPARNVWEIGDYLAAVYYAAALAYEENTDRKNADFAATLRKLAVSRMTVRNPAKNRTTDKQRWF